MVAVGIKVYDSRGVAHPGDGGRVELLVLKQVISLCQSVTVSNSELAVSCICSEFCVFSQKIIQHNDGIASQARYQIDLVC